MIAAGNLAQWLVRPVQRSWSAIGKIAVLDRGNSRHRADTSDGMMPC